MKIPRGFQMNFAIMGTHVESRCSWTGVILAIFCVIHITPIVLDDLSVLRRFVSIAQRRASWFPFVQLGCDWLRVSWIVPLIEMKKFEIDEEWTDVHICKMKIVPLKIMRN